MRLSCPEYPSSSHVRFKLSLLFSNYKEHPTSSQTGNHWKTLSTQLVFLINNVFRIGIFPDVWKLATVIPLFKGGNAKNVANFRPVSLLPLPSKIIEKIIHNRISNHLEAFGLLDDKQGGFRKNHSTINTIAKLTGDIFEGINNRNMTVACFIDMAKAFDTVNHNILCKKLLKIGVSGILSKLISNYLSNRKQCTLANGITSSYHNIVCGVPKGSILGPLLFIIYMNHLKNICKNSKYLLFADDTVIYNTKEIVQATIELESDLNNFKTWCDQNQLTMNVQKTKYVIFGMRSQTKHIFQHELFIQRQKLNKVASYKYLGMILDMNLTFNNHLQQVNNVVSHKCLLLSKLRKYINTYTAIILYKSMILPIMEYGDMEYMEDPKVNL